jgi:ElaB/YqjD/DUF883 family membrane-anchored ribosome-binding protein
MTEEDAMEENIQTTATSRAFARELQSMLKEAENLLRNAGQQIRNEYRAVKDQVASTVTTSLADAKQGYSTVEETVLSRTRNAAQSTNRFVLDHPWQAVAMGVCAGFLAGMIVSRR